MATIQSTIELQDNMSSVLASINSTLDATVNAVNAVDDALGKPVDATGLDGVQQAAEEATEAVDDLDDALNGVGGSPITDPTASWRSDGLEIFTNTGIERFESEVQSLNLMMDSLSMSQQQINLQASTMSVLPAAAQTDLSNMNTRLQKIQQRISQIESNPLNIGSDAANAGLEEMRAQLLYAQQLQEQLNLAVDSMDVERANAAYLQLSQTISGTEKYIRDNVDEQGKFNTVVEKSDTLVDKLKENIAGIATKIAAITAAVTAVTKIVSSATDAYDTQLNAELQLATVLGNMLDADTVAEYAVTLDTSEAEAGAAVLSDTFDEITSKASEIQAAGIYGDEAMIAAAAELATYYSDADAIVMMMDTLADYAMGMSGGGAVDTEAMVEYATNLGKIMSGSYESMTKKGFEFTDAQEAIIEGTATEEQIIETLGEEYLDLSEDMQAAAAITQVIEESWSGLYETMSDTPEGQIIQMQNAFGDLVEVVGGQLYPYLLLIVEAVNENWSTIESVMNALTTALSVIIGIAAAIVDTVLSIATAIADNWSWISPIIYGVAAALLVYNAATIASKIASMASAAATAIWTAAQNGLNAALAACPLVWVITIIIAVIAAIYAVVAALNQFAGTSISATGIIVGVLSTAAAFIGNLFVALINAVIDIFAVLWNFIATFANFFANVFNDPVAAIANLFAGLADTILGILETLAGAIDTLFGSNLADAVSGWRDSLSSAVADLYSEQEEIMATIDSESLHVDAFDYGEAWSAGYALGESLEDSLSDFSISDLFGTTDTTDVSDYLSSYTYSGSDLASDVSDISDDTSDISDSLDITDEELKYLRDLAEQEVINRFTTAEINVDMSGITNNVSSQMDLDGLMSGLTDAVNTAVMSMAQGVHA